ncbi:hypothetical protein [Flavobacterium sp.]|uniref:hypothetical protein n=1 Tax=Flavobacterium sp. TaxID=239 RepID=UPI00286A5A11|nr:hypothetical protein [Flavobacterium sp.]
MKTRIILSACFAFLFASPILAQDRTTVNATSSEISDNLDLRAIASIFGDAKNLDDFERQLNDPKIQISNLDLNEDNQVDYLRVIESVEDNTHLIIIQSVLGKDTFQDVATIEVERDRNNQVQVQVVGDVYMYGQNYIYEPVYVATPIIYATFWAPHYRPYCSTWFWNYYPTYYYAWNPCPVFRYRHNIGIHINFNNHYDYVTTRRCTRAVVMHQPIRGNYCERTYPTRAFTYRNNNYANRYELDRTRNVRTVGTRDDLAYNNTRNGRNNDPIKQSVRNDVPYTTRSNGRNNDPIKQSTRNDAPYTTRSNGRNNDPIKQSTRNETNIGGRQHSESNIPIKSSNGSLNNSNGGQRTRTESTTRYDYSNSGVKSPTNSNEGRSHERTETRNNNSGSSRGERSSNERGNRR